MCVCSVALYSSAFWLPSYIFVHTVLILVGLWACNDKESVIAAIAVRTHALTEMCSVHYCVSFRLWW